MALPLISARVYVPANTWKADITVTGTADVDAATITVPAGWYYLKTSDSAGDSLVTTIDGLLEAAYPASNFTVDADLATGIVTIGIQVAGSISWAWNTGTYGTGFRNWLGFGATGDFGPIAFGNSQSGSEEAQGLVFVGSVGRTNYHREKRQKTVSGSRSESGSVAKLAKSGRRYETSWEHHFEPLSRTTSPLKSGIFDEAGTVRPWAWEDFFDHCAIQPFRYYADRSSSDYESKNYDLTPEAAREFEEVMKEEGVEHNLIVRIGAWRYGTNA